MIKDYKAFALKELLAQRVTSALLLMAVILSTVMTAVIGQSAGILSAMRQQQAVMIGGDRYVTFLQMNEEKVKKLENDPRLSFVGEYISLGTAELNASLSLGLNEYHEDVSAVYPARSGLKEGRLPELPMETALPEDVLQYLGFQGQIGDKITLSLSKSLRHGVETADYPFTADLVLTGILESDYLNYTAGAVNGIVGEGTAEALLPDNYLYYNVDIRTADKKHFQDTVDSLISSLEVHELDTMYNAAYLDALGISYEKEAADADVSAQGFSYLLMAGIMTGVLFLLAAGLVIYNILKIAVSRKIGQYGVLRALGAERGQLYALVSTQVLLLCLIGIPIGLLAGALSAEGILTAATGLLSPEIFLVQNAEELNRLIAENSAGKGGFLLVSALITLISAHLAALPAARYAGKTAPAAVFHGRREKIRRKNRTVRRIRSFERYYARLNLGRNKGRSLLTILSLVMSIAVFITLQGSVSLLDTAGQMGEHLGDYSIINETAGFSQDDLREMEEDEHVSSVAAFQLTLYDNNGTDQPAGISLGFSMHPGETFQIVGMNEAYMEAALSDVLSEAELEQLKTGEDCVVRNPVPFVFEGQEIPRTELHAGEEIIVDGRELSVLHTLDGYDKYFSVGSSGFTNGVQIIVNSALYAELTGKAQYHELLPVLREGADRDAFDAVMEALAERVPGSTWLSYEETDRQLADSFEQIRLLALGIVLFVGLIGLLNIVNTMYTNVHTRTAEIGIQRAVGMSRESLYKMFLWEGAYCGIIASAAGCVIGYIGLLFVEAGNTGTLQMILPPVGPMAEAVLLSVGACLLAACVPLRRISRMGIVEAVESVE